MSMVSQNFYSVVVPIYKDSALAWSFCEEFKNVFSRFLNTDVIHEHIELIFVIDGSGKPDELAIKEVCNKYNFVKAIVLSTNFGQHIALSAGYANATGNYVGMFNVDQQDPISEYPKFIEHINASGLDIVYGLRKTRKGSGLDSLTSKAFNIALNKLTGNKTPINVSTMRIMSRRFVDAYNQLSERDRYLPGLESWLGFDVGYVDTIHVDRKEGKSSYNFSKRLKMAVHSILSFSDYPLRLLASFGIGLSLLGFASVLVIIFLKIFLIDFQAGYVSLITAITFFSGIIIFAIGLSSLYIGKILKEVQQRPVYVIKDKFNFQK